MVVTVTAVDPTQDLSLPTVPQDLLETSQVVLEATQEAALTQALELVLHPSPVDPPCLPDAIVTRAALAPLDLLVLLVTLVWTVKMVSLAHLVMPVPLAKALPQPLVPWKTASSVLLVLKVLLVLLVVLAWPV